MKQVLRRLGGDRPSRWLLGLAGLLIATGQISVLTGRLTGGLLATGVAVLLGLLALAGDDRLRGAMRRIADFVHAGVLRLEASITRWGLDRRSSVEPGPPVLGAETRDAEDVSAPLPIRSRIWLDREAVLPKPLVIGVGLLLLLAGQPLLLAERFVPALAVLLPALGLLLLGLLRRGPGIALGRTGTLLRFGLLALPGAGLIVVGDLMMKHAIEISLAREIIGFGLHAAGVLMMLALLPNILPDPEPEPDELDRPVDGARTPSQWITKILLVVLFLFLVMFARQAAVAGAFSRSVWLSLLAVAALGLSFPWSRASRPETEDGLVWRILGRLFRLVAWGAALYLGYRGQVLISQEQVYPGLFRFAAAAVALAVALREPRPGEPDRLREKPLAWYWEALGVVAILGVSIFLRAYLLDSMPFGIECDEAGAGYHAADILHNQFNSITVHPSGRPLLMLLPKVVAFHFFGMDNVGMRFMAMVWGVAGVLVFYLLARSWYGPRVALAAAALLAFSRWHIHFSRFGWSNTLMLVLQMIGLYFLMQGLRSRRTWQFVLSGVALALSLHTETAARMVPIICAGLLGYFWLTRRHFLRRNWAPMMALLLGAWLASANLFMFWLNKPQFLTKRVQEVSVFSEDANAPKDLLPGLVTSAKLSLLQLNWHGDSRTRHNGGMSGEPVLDFWSAILFALAVGVSLYRWRRLRYFLPLIWFFGFMGASIFALEAPQSHRAFGVVPAVFLLIAAFLDRSRRLLRETFGRPGALAGGLAFLLLLIPIGRINYHKYFDTFPGFDTNCTAAARYMGRVWPNAYHAIMSAFLWAGHPPFILYARDFKGHFYYAPSEIVPFRQDTDRDVVFTTIFEYPPILPVFQYFYPKGEFHEEVHPKFELLFRSWAVQHADILATRGLEASYYDNPDWQGQPRVVRKDPEINAVWEGAAWPLPGAGSVSWKGTLLIPHWGTYTFYLYGTDEIELRLDGRHVLRSGGKQETRLTVDLPGGLHTLRMRARHTTPGGRVLLAWSSSTGFPWHFNPLQDRFGKQPVPSTHVFTYPEAPGLLGTFYSTDHWSGRVRLQQVEPAVFYFWMGNPYGLDPPLSAEWRGWLQVDQGGEYRFDLEATGYGEVEIDGRLVLRQGGKPAEWPDRTAGPNPVALTPGRHALAVRWSMQYGRTFKFWWTRPGSREREVVPPGVLRPAVE